MHDDTIDHTIDRLTSIAKKSNLFNVTTGTTMLEHVNSKNDNQLAVMEMAMTTATATPRNSAT